MEEIINNIMQSPENTNPNVLRGQLQGMASGGGGVLVVHSTRNANRLTLDKTWKEIHGAPYAVLNMDRGTGTDYAPISYTSIDEGEYIVVFRNFFESEDYVFTIDNENSYPFRETK